MTSQLVVKSKAHFIQAKFTGTMTYTLQNNQLKSKLSIPLWARRMARDREPHDVDEEEDRAGDEQIR
jgi:hypothetical protein